MKPQDNAARCARRGPSGRDRQRGFTLIETSVALLIMMVAGLSIASVFAYAASYNKGANGRASAQALAQRQMEFLRKTDFDLVVASTQVVTRSGLSYSVVTDVCNDGTPACGGSTAIPLNSGTGWASRPVVLVTLRNDPTLGPFYH
jgi:prepilin-type N-terminal cleavage/methylation domain-containing protein